MIRRSINQQQKHGAPPADLLVCFPSRAHFTLIPKKLLSNSPARLMDHSFHQHHRNINNQLKKLPSSKLADSSWDKAKIATTSCSDDVSEPSSPKVTCAGQIKVRPSSRSGSAVPAANCKSWQSVMEEIERIHKKSKNETKKKVSWGDALGIKKDVMQFLTCLRSIKLDFRCFGAVPECDFSSDEEDEEKEEEADCNKKNINHSESENCKEDQDTVTTTSSDKDKDSRRVFSDWFMVLQDLDAEKDAAEEAPSAAPPPPNALLLMRCRSAPAKSWLENRAKLIVEQEEEEEEGVSSSHKEAYDYKEQQQDDEVLEAVDDDDQAEKGRKKLGEYLFVMEQYDTDFYKLSNDIAKETWVVGSINPFSRSRSWKR